MEASSKTVSYRRVNVNERYRWIRKNTSEKSKEVSHSQQNKCGNLGFKSECYMYIKKSK